MGNTDTIKLLFTYVIATIVIAGGGYALFVARQDPQPNDFSLVIAGFIGAAISFVFGQEVATRASRSTEKAHEAGVYAGAASPTLGNPQAFEDTYEGDAADGDLAAPPVVPITTPDK